MRRLPAPIVALPAALLALTACAADPSAPSKDAPADGWTALFNGKDLDGWRNPYAWGEAKVQDGEIHLTADRKFFLTTAKTWGDFELEVQVKLPAEGGANSGIMYRCHVEPGKVYGYQAECDPSPRGWTGRLYDEGRRAWKVPPSTVPLQPLQAPQGEWIRYRIYAVGDHLRVWVNGQATTDVHDATDAAGHIGLQHHGEKGQTYRFRGIRIRPASAADTAAVEARAKADAAQAKAKPETKPEAKPETK